MNTTIFRQFYEQIPERTRTILIAVLAFGIGTLFGGSGGGNGRYVPAGASGLVILDTKTGTIWTEDPVRGTYTRQASLSYF